MDQISRKSDPNVCVEIDLLENVLDGRLALDVGGIFALCLRSTRKCLP